MPRLVAHDLTGARGKDDAIARANLPACVARSRARSYEEALAALTL
jgi:hypothetical protein